MDKTDFPAVIENYLLAHDRHDTDAAVVTFGPDATVIDENVAYVGTERIRWFLDHSASEFTYTRSLTGVEDLGEDPDRWLVIGPDTAGNLLELVVLVNSEGDETIIHSMPLRPVYRRLLDP